MLSKSLWQCNNAYCLFKWPLNLGNRCQLQLHALLDDILFLTCLLLLTASLHYLSFEFNAAGKPFLRASVNCAGDTRTYGRD
jgi:hypothetical protein